MISKKASFLLILVAVSSFLLGQTVILHKTDNTIAKVKPNDSVLGSSTGEETASMSDGEHVKKLIDTFEKLQIDKNATEVMALFSPTKTPEDANDYLFIMSLDLFDTPHPAPRLYMTAGMQSCVKSYSIGSIEEHADNWIAHVDELRCLYDNTTGNRWDKAEKMIVEVSNAGPHFMLEKYYPEKGKTSKFAGFLL